MIRIYCQYSYGGFRTFFIEGTENEEVRCEVTNEEFYGFPQDAQRYFQYGGAKIVYRQLSNGLFDLVVREIPSIHTDGDGRHIPCAVQFIGEAADRDTLDYMALDIANDVLAFEDFFSKLFYVRLGLRIHGEKLRKYIRDHEQKVRCDTEVAVLGNIPRIRSGVLLFVPMSSNFGVNETVTKNVCAELGLDIKELKEKKCVISTADLAKIKGKTTLTVMQTDENKEETNEELTKSLPVEISRREEKRDVPSDIQAERLQKRIETLEEENATYRKYLYVCVVIILFLIFVCMISMCSSCD